MERFLRRFKISGVLITQKILNLGQEVFVIRGTFVNRKKGLGAGMSCHVFSLRIGLRKCPDRGLLCWYSMCCFLSIAQIITA